MFDHKKATEKCRALRVGSATTEELLRYLREAGATPIESIKALVALGSTLADGKEILHWSETWADIRQESEALHEKLENVANEYDPEG